MSKSSNAWALPSNAISGSAYQWMVTSAVMVNTGITKISSLLQEKQSGARHGAWERAHWKGPVMTFAVMSYCTRHLPEVWPDAFYFISRVMPVGKKCQKTCPRPVTANYIVYGGITRPAALATDALVHTNAERSAVLHGDNFTVTHSSADDSQSG